MEFVQNTLQRIPIHQIEFRKIGPINEGLRCVKVDALLVKKKI